MTTAHRRNDDHANGLKVRMNLNQRVIAPRAEMMYSRLEIDPRVETIRSLENDRRAGMTNHHSLERGLEAGMMSHHNPEKDLGVETILNRIMVQITMTLGQILKKRIMMTTSRIRGRE